MAHHVLVSGFCIRHAQKEDVDAACEIAKCAWARIHDSFRTIMGPEMHGVVCANWENNKAVQVRGHFEQHPDWFYVVIQEVDEKVVGFVTVRINKEKSLGTIGNNAIDPNLQGRGLGSAMHCFVLDRFKMMGLRFASVTTGLDEGHAPARRAYEKAGFHIRQEDVTYYKAL